MISEAASNGFSPSSVPLLLLATENQSLASYIHILTLNGIFSCVTAAYENVLPFSIICRGCRERDLKKRGYEMGMEMRIIICLVTATHNSKATLAPHPTHLLLFEILHKLINDRRP